MTEISECWRFELGIRVDFDIHDRVGLQISQYSFGFGGWLADYPDPDDYLRKSSFIVFLHRMGWRNEEYQGLIERAEGLANRSQRLALYRQADRLLVTDHVLVIPLIYSGFSEITLVKPWVKNYKTNLLGHSIMDKVMIDNQLREAILSP